MEKREFETHPPREEVSFPAAGSEWNQPDPEREFSPPRPEAEFSPVGSQLELPRRTRRKRKIRTAAFTVMLVILLLMLRPPQLPGLPQIRPAPAEEPPASEPLPTPEPTAATAPTPTPAPTPAPTPEPEPGYQVLYFQFSHAHYGRLRFTRPEAFRSVHLEIWEPYLDLTVASFDLAPEDYADGEYLLPMQSTGDVFEAHMDEYLARDVWPEALMLRGTVSYEKDGELVEESFTQEPDYEQGWGLTWWPEDEPASDWTFPGCFVFATYESEVPLEIVVNDPDGVKAGVLGVSIRIDGLEIPAEAYRFEPYEETWTAMDRDGNQREVVFYYARAVVEKPDWAPEHGVAHAVVTQLLEGSGEIWVSEQDVEY